MNELETSVKEGKWREGLEVEERRRETTGEEGRKE